MSLSPFKSPAILVLLTLITVHAQAFNRCSRPLQAPTIRYQAMMASRKLESLPNHEWNLLYQMFRNPCIELQYHGRSVALFSRLVIYGTCDYRRMFRFSARQSYYSCWRMDLTIWNPTAAVARQYRRRYVTDVYDIKMAGVRYSTVTVDKDNSTYCVVFTPDDIKVEHRLSYSQILNVLRHEEWNLEGEPAELVHCDCENRSLADMWLTGKKDQRQGESSGWDSNQLAGIAALLIGLMVIVIGVCRFLVIR